MRNGWRLWGEQYERRLADILSMEQDIARELSEKLCVRLTGEDRNRLAKRYTDNPQAYAGLAHAWVLFAFFSLEPPAETMPRAKEATLRALALDDSLAEAHAAWPASRNSTNGTGRLPKPIADGPSS